MVGTATTNQIPPPHDLFLVNKSIVKTTIELNVDFKWILPNRLGHLQGEDYPFGEMPLTEN